METHSQAVEYDNQLLKLIHLPDFVDTICAHIAEGGTLITLAEAWKVRYSDLANYMAQNKMLTQRMNAAYVARNEWEVERMIQELRAIATCDIREAYNDDGSLKKVKDMPANVAAALSSVEVDELFEGVGREREQIGVTKKVKFWDKAKAIELFMKKHGLLIDRHRVEIETRLEDLVGAVNADVVMVETPPPSTLIELSTDLSTPSTDAKPELSEGIEPATPLPGVLDSPSIHD